MYNNKNYNNKNYNNNNYNNNRNSPSKKSGAKYSKITKGNYAGATIINAWNTSKSKGLITATVFPYKNSKIYKNSQGQEKQTMMASVEFKNSGIQRLIPCSLNLVTKVVTLPEIGMCISPNGSGRTSSGKLVKGYFGTFNPR